MGIFENQTEISISEKLNEIDIPQQEKDLIIENGLRFRILESENELRKVNSEIHSLEDIFGKEFEELERVGLPDNADYKMHESFMDLEALVLDRLELLKKIGVLKKLYDSE